MNHIEYLDKIKKRNKKIKKENLLFWNLWNLNFVFENIESNKCCFYDNLCFVFDLLWEMNDNYIVINNKIINEFTSIIDLNYDKLDELSVSDKAVKEFFEGVESIFNNIKEQTTVIYNAYEHPINLIDVMIGGINISSKNTNSIYLNEVKSQFKLIDELIREGKKYNKKDCNIHR